jgi:type II secretory ATPase GspE/PulE/Tfp pilus assembly ATPase PilB-like protein
MDVIGQNPLFVSAIRMVMAQRLVRRLDDATKQPYKPDQATLEQLEQVITSLPEGIPRPDLKGAQFYKPGSSAENPYGYNGQLALREQFLMNGPIRDLLEHSGSHLSTQEIEKAALSSGMLTMLQDGVLKALAGQTTLEEVYRVIG